MAPPRRRPPGPAGQDRRSAARRGRCGCAQAYAAVRRRPRPEWAPRSAMRSFAPREPLVPGGDPAGMTVATACRRRRARPAPWSASCLVPGRSTRKVIVSADVTGTFSGDVYLAVLVQPAPRQPELTVAVLDAVVTAAADHALLDLEKVGEVRLDPDGEPARGGLPAQVAQHDVLAHTSTDESLALHEQCAVGQAGPGPAARPGMSRDRAPPSSLRAVRQPRRRAGVATRTGSGCP